MSEEMRKEFEEWAVSHQYTIRPAVTNCGVIIDEKYGHHSVQIAWESWQASREAMKPIKLPKETDTSTCKSIEKEILHDGINYGIQQCKEAIQQAGYKVEE